MATESPWVGPPRPDWPTGPFVALLDAIRRLHVETAGTIRLTAGHDAADVRITAMDGYLTEVARGTAHRPGPYRAADAILATIEAHLSTGLGCNCGWRISTDQRPVDPRAQHRAHVADILARSTTP